MPEQDPQAWEALWVKHRSSWLSMVKLAGKREQAVRNCEANMLREHLVSRVCLPKVTHCTGDLGSFFACDLCSWAGTSQKALALHRAHKHQQKCRTRAICTGTSCRFCGREYWSRAMLRRHWRTSRCEIAARLWEPTAEQLEQAALDDEAERTEAASLRTQGRRELSAVMPAMSSQDAWARRLGGDRDG